MTTLTPITLQGSIAGWTGQSLYGENDGLGLANQYSTYTITVSSIVPQTHGDASTREPNAYNALDITEGMFLSNTDGNTILKISEITAKSADSFSCTVEDVDMMSYRLYSSNTIELNEQIRIFSLNPEGEPVFAGAPFNTQGLQKVQSRFSLNEKDDRVKFTQNTPTDLRKGDIVSVDTNGKLAKYGTPNSSEVKVGIVVDVYRGGKDVFVKPFNDIVREYADAESLTGNPGDVYYTDVNNAGEITTATGGKSVFMHLNNKVATTVNITSSIDPSSNDLIEINRVTIFDGPNGDTVADVVAFKDLLNTKTNETFVSAAITQAPGEINAEGNTLAYTDSDHGITGQDMLNIVGEVGQTPSSLASITIGDGVNAPVTITFDTPDITIYGGTYNAMSATAILAAFTNAISGGNLDLVAELYDSTDHNGQAVKISTTGTATGIFLTNLSSNGFGANAVGSGGFTGLTLTASLGASTLTLTRNSGGPIEIDGSPLAGGYINQSGVVSSKNGRAPYLLLIESEGGSGLEATGVDVKEDLDKTPLTTSVDGDSTGIQITYSPFSDGAIVITVNGLGANIGDAVKNQACYFSSDGGTNAKAVANISAGDTLYWNGSISKFELDPTDEIDLIYQASSLDII
jgi:hypothetical protein|tara:strand:- start:531 stop:2426 length:1896 start_codon:yes stop_codon:yes gene_type:complete